MVGPINVAKVHVPLHTVSNNDTGTDLEIKVEWTNDNNTISKRFYKGWRLHEVFDHKKIGSFTTSISSSAKFSENGEWYSYDQVTVVRQKYRMELVIHCKEWFRSSNIIKKYI